MNQASYKVLIYPSAESDLREIKKYFEQTLQITANKLFEKLYRQIDLLESFPFSFPLVKDPYLKNLGYRIIPIDNYIVFYIVSGNEVQVHRFIYGKRNYLNLLKD